MYTAAVSVAAAPIASNRPRCLTQLAPQPCPPAHTATGAAPKARPDQTNITDTALEHCNRSSTRPQQQHDTPPHHCTFANQTKDVHAGQPTARPPKKPAVIMTTTLSQAGRTCHTDKPAITRCTTKYLPTTHADAYGQMPFLLKGRWAQARPQTQHLGPDEQQIITKIHGLQEGTMRTAACGHKTNRQNLQPERRAEPQMAGCTRKSCITRLWQQTMQAETYRGNCLYVNCLRPIWGCRMDRCTCCEKAGTTQTSGTRSCYCC